MKPIDFRNDTFDSLQTRLAGLREQVWLDWTAYEMRRGNVGATTREVAATSKIDILTFRPRSTELYQLGVLMLAPIPQSEIRTPHSTEGRYRLRTTEEWQAWFYAARNTALMNQKQL